jgi:hypothetical protein
MSASATDLKPQPDVATRLLAGVSVPDTPTISRSIEFAREKSEPYLLIMSCDRGFLLRFSLNANRLRTTAKFSR